MPLDSMFVAILLAATALGSSPADGMKKKPTVAILTLEPAVGVSAATARVLTDHLVEEVRTAKTFSLVTSSQEVESLLGFERQKQLADCSEISCMAELAGALGVEFILVGSLSKLGLSYLMNIKLLDVRTARTLSSLSKRVQGDTEEVLLDAIRPMVQQLLVDAGLNPHFPEESAPQQTPSTAPVAPEHAESHPLRPPLLGLGGAGLAASPVLLLAGGGALLGVALAQTTLQAGLFNGSGIPFIGRLFLVYGSSAVLLGTSLLSLLLAVMAGVVGAGGVVAGVVAG